MELSCVDRGACRNDRLHARVVPPRDGPTRRWNSVPRRWASGRVVDWYLPNGAAAAGIYDTCVVQIRTAARRTGSRDEGEDCASVE